MPKILQRVWLGAERDWRLSPSLVQRVRMRERCTSTRLHRIADSKHVFPLLQLSLGVKERLVGAEQSLVTLAASRIQTIDHRTVSIVQFEHTLLGCYKKPSPFGASP